MSAPWSALSSPVKTFGRIWEGRATTTSSAEELRYRLERFGLSGAAIEAAWPRWWSEAADGSASARAELRFSLARRLGLDPRSLLSDTEAPRFVWEGQQARFKNRSGEEPVELAGITSFGRAVSAVLIEAIREPSRAIVGRTAREMREAILGTDRPFVALGDLLALAWGVGIPVVHLRVFPWPQKRMAAMTVGLGGHWSVLLGKEASYPAHIAFYLAHELGHIALEHVASGDQIVDLEDDPDEDAAGAERREDPEERAADAFALELLTGRQSPTFLPERRGWASASELARTARSVAEQLHIEPGTVALGYGHSTGDWQLANAAMRYIYPRPARIWAAVNDYARGQIDLERVGSDGADFLEAVLAGP